MAVNVSPGINIKIHVTSDTDGLATKEYVAEQVSEKGLPDGGTDGQLVGKVGDEARWIDPPSGGAEVDPTLTQEGAAADAKAVGDKIGQLSEDKPYQQYVTGADGKAKWEERLAYKQTSESIFAVEQKVNTTKAPYGSSISGSGVCNGDIVYSKTYRVTFNGVDYNCVAHVGRNSMNFLGDSALSAANVSDGSDEFSNGEPFAVRTNAGVFYLFTESAGEYTVTISEIEEEVKRLDSDLLPEIVPAVDQPHMQLVTDASGEKKWVERTHYNNTVKFADLSVKYTDMSKVCGMNYYLQGPYEYTGFSKEDLIGATILADASLCIPDRVLAEEDIAATDGGSFYVKMSSLGAGANYEAPFVVVTEADVANGTTICYCTFGAPGLYVASYYAGSWQYVNDIVKIDIKTIEPEYLPANAVVIYKKNGVVSCNTPLENIEASILSGKPWIYVTDNGTTLESLSGVYANYERYEYVCYINVYDGGGSFVTGFEYNENGIVESVDS